MLEVILSFGPALVTVFSGLNPLFLLFGAVVGLVIGILPGIGGVVALSLLIPFSWGMDPTSAMIMMGAAMGSVTYGGSITAILLNVPGTASNVSTLLDGYPMTVKGRAGVALGASASSTVLGSLFGLVVLVVLIPVVSILLMSFAPPEFFLLAVVGIVSIAFLTTGNVFRSLFAGAVGLMLSVIGISPVTGTLRFTFGATYLLDGIDYSAAIMGLFAVSEAFKLAMGGYKPAAKVRTEQKFSHVMEGIMSPIRHLALFIQSSIIGTVIGIIPGVGGTVAGMLAWIAGAATSKKAKFGTGVVGGVIASESAMSAKDGGSLLPTVAFGIPGSAEMAVLLGAFTLHGLQPGPGLLTTQLPTVSSLIFALMFACIIVTVIGVFSAKYLAKISMVPGYIVAPTIIVLTLVGAFVIRQSIWDSFVCLATGIFAFFMMKWGFSRMTLAVGLILGEIAELNLGLTLQITRTGGLIFLTRPISLALVIVIVVTVLLAIIIPLRKRPAK
ncbi:MAG: tripartite tricarboxylate transporter permease [Chloroflexota bacterium]|nr:tripartite tricarboxylate transporter permease [Chloroflexota bacterium]